MGRGLMNLTVLDTEEIKGNVIPEFDITYSYQGHEGEYSTIDLLSSVMTLVGKK